MQSGPITGRIDAAISRNGTSPFGGAFAERERGMDREQVLELREVLSSVRKSWMISMQGRIASHRV